MLRITLGLKPPKELHAAFDLEAGTVLLMNGRKLVLIDLTDWDQVQQTLLASPHEEWDDLLHQSLVGSAAPADLVAAVRTLLLLSPNAAGARLWEQAPALGTALAPLYDNKRFTFANHRVEVLATAAAEKRDAELTEQVAQGRAFRLKAANDSSAYQSFAHLPA
jgi:hypothetical protein